MHLSIDHHSGVPVSAQIAEQIKYLCVSGKLRPGEALPSVRALAAKLNLNPTTIARVYSQLEAEAIIYTQQGRGTFVALRRSVLTLEEKRRRVRGDLRRVVIEAGRIGLDYAELVRLLEQEIGAITPSERGSMP